MASITLDIASTSEKIPVNDLELETVTNTDLIDGAVSQGILPPPPALTKYVLLDKSNVPAIDTATLSSLGFIDGDIIKVVAKPGGARQ